ncbi:host attachment protein [Sulfurimonas sp. SWIR-19]|uniref:host attachment protein n=1 Tax=Sulfurimonas sp. SWIR-19 TaxID=2878390 RepID=UPI001CF374A4|nr:host attachment protein [Sulfurimonas sp. SWIR-19]UCN00928.1 host attachment protein [Sulfurimonas sp. SWIR-19]
MKLDNTVIIVADLGELKAYKTVKHEDIYNNELKINYSLELVNAEDFIEGRKKLHELKSDANGRKGHATIEEHSVEETIAKRTLTEVAEDIDMIVQQTQPKSLFLAFPQENNAELLDKLSQDTKAVLKKNVALDLVKVDKNKLFEYFN